ncbi:hypothetical protein K504DRAFT_505894 [Pleomassaria siparia CBS 279.74]|uniref:Uncharacterized protein n=1 Tax=Pleomassaria siparia CBS 279.74 TaxID=1314801 RepID=A0A6G1JZA0_9PLEO|nr:hypothetical protein K504DRAFT_505894 [Pleomassaria siparia CBS 279.74]
MKHTDSRSKQVPDVRPQPDAGASNVRLVMLILTSKQFGQHYYLNPTPRVATDYEPQRRDIHKLHLLGQCFYFRHLEDDSTNLLDLSSEVFYQINQHIMNEKAWVEDGLKYLLQTNQIPQLPGNPSHLLGLHYASIKTDSELLPMRTYCPRRKSLHSAHAND